MITLLTYNLQEITGESLARGANAAPNARLDIHAWVFGLDRVPHPFFDVWVYHPNVESHKDLTPQQMYCIASMNTRRNVCMQSKLWRWNKPHSRRWCSLLQVAWHLSVKSITSDQRNSCQPRKARTTRLRCLG